MRHSPLQLYISLLSVALSGIPSHAQTKHPFTFEDMMALRRVAEPVPSPDGKWVLFSAVDVNLEANTKTPHVWIVPLGVSHPSPVLASLGEGERVLIDQDADRPRWAPDGKRFAFISSKEGGSQIWVADFDGAAGTVTGVYRLTVLGTEVDAKYGHLTAKPLLSHQESIPNATTTSSSGSTTAISESAIRPKSRR